MVVNLKNKKAWGLHWGNLRNAAAKKAKHLWDSINRSIENRSKATGPALQDPALIRPQLDYHLVLFCKSHCKRDTDK